MTETLSNTLTTVAGRRVKVVRGKKSQTINVCTPLNRIGAYDITYRLAPDVEVTTAELAGLADLPAVDAWALARGGDPEVPGEPGAPAVVSVPPPSLDDAWLVSARAAVDRAITRLVDEFMEDPYLHRVEHSLHTLLHSLLKQEPVLAVVVPLGTSPHRTQLVHKEWPETTAVQGLTGKVVRGNFDIGVLSPAQVSSATLKQFRAGRIAAPLAIEVGLDYGANHLQQDADKLLHSKVSVPYLLHLSRINVTDQVATEQLLCAPNSPLRTAYVHIDPDTGVRRFKHVGDTGVTSRSAPRTTSTT
jgi:hypothetical protein